ncbi:MAG: Rrf2 family transcriptional regulator [Planctomycetota bacterium]
MQTHLEGDVRVSRAVSYAISALLQLESLKVNGPVPCSRIALQGDMPERFLLQVLRSLVNAGYLTSTRGVEGGYALVSKLEELTVLDIIEAVDGPISAELPDAGGLNETAKQKLRVLQEEATDATKKLASEVTLRSLAQTPPSANPPIPHTDFGSFESPSDSVKPSS